MTTAEPAFRHMIRVALGVALLWSSHGVLAAEVDGAAVSLAQLTGDPDSYHGKAVVVSGYMSLGFERHSLCPTARQAAGKDCVWLSGGSPDWHDLNGKRVTLRGTYDKRFLGHLSCCAGTVRATERPVLTPDPR